jgi:cellobiose phosphorylase
VERGESANSEAHGWQPIGSHHLKAASAAWRSARIIFLLGYHENDPADKFVQPGSQIIKKDSDLTDSAAFLQPRAWTAPLGNSKPSGIVSWQNSRCTPRTRTPTAWVNIWNAYQCMVTFNMSRSASYFESGIGRGWASGIPTRPIGLCAFGPRTVARAYSGVGGYAAQNGGAFHQYQPLTKRGNNDVGSGFNDDPLWLVCGVSAYVKETGDMSILDELVQYENQPGTEMPLYEHLQAP